MQKNKKTLFVIIQKNKITKEILIFGEIKIKNSDSYELKGRLNDKNLFHRYYLEEKKHFKNNEKIIFEDIIND
tara:strand:+ start:1622 stop:1840 length:219 start_codon:yes stop_codon:yes gene_type:complete